MQINDELEVHTGLLGVLDTELDGTEARMAGARRRLTRVARGAKENGTASGSGRRVELTVLARLDGDHRSAHSRAARPHRCIQNMTRDVDMRVVVFYIGKCLVRCRKYSEG